MFKPTKLATAVALSIFLVGCANIDDSHKQSEKTFESYQKITDQYKLDQDWWKLYHDPQLDKLVAEALANNKDLAKAAIAVNVALYKANLVGASLVPNFTGTVGASVQKNIKTGQNTQLNPNGGFPPSTVPVLYNGSINVGYTLDLWRRMADQTSAAEWQHSASEEDLESAKLSLVNAVVGTYYQLAYLKEAIAITEQSIHDFKQINRIMLNKKAQGVVDGASTNQTERAVLAAENNLSQLQDQQKVVQAMMRNLLNLKPSDPLNIQLPNLLNTKLAGVNLNVPVSVIANRPDVKSKLYSLNSAFKNAKATQKSWFPTVTLGASLGGRSDRIGTTLHSPFASGLVSLNLPFLSWNTVRWNVKISEAAYNLAKVNFEQSITTALNEIDKNYFAYQQAQEQFNNEEGIYNTSAYMARYYKNRYTVGVTELRDWLNAKNSENAAKLALLGAKNKLIQTENAIYSAMGGYYAK